MVALESLEGNQPAWGAFRLFHLPGYFKSLAEVSLSMLPPTGY